MKPFLATVDGKGYGQVVVLDFIMMYYGTAFAVVTSPTGGRIWTEPVDDLREALPADDWPEPYATVG